MRVELSSEPPGAEVVAFNGDNIGVTPLTLEGEKLERLAEAGLIAVTLSAPGYVERELVMELRGRDSYNIRLKRLDREYFATRLLKDFGPETNEMVRGLMHIQGLILASKLVEAEKDLTEYQNMFPNVAASYVLFASLESQRGKPDVARKYLTRARELDPKDPVVLRMLGSPSEVRGGKKP